MDRRLYAYYYQPTLMSDHSSMYPLIKVLKAEPIRFDPHRFWRNFESISWTLCDFVRNATRRYYRSTYYSLVPFLDEARLFRKVAPGSILHHIWAEFSLPRSKKKFLGKGISQVGTFHATTGNIEQILGRIRTFDMFDWITVMSETVRDFFTERGVPEERVTTILHGVDIEFFAPVEESEFSDGPLRGLIVGGTHRDHKFMAEVMKRVSSKHYHLYVLTKGNQIDNYKGVPHVTILPRLSDQDLANLYRRSDLMTIPMAHAAANNAVLEAMACGTPVMINRVGGTPEYVSEDCCFLMEDKNVDEWVEGIETLSKRREDLRRLRPAVRQWAKRFDWNVIAGSYRKIYEALSK